MTERPILFSAPMVRALLDGTKMQTRRVVKPQPDTRPGMNCTRLIFKDRKGMPLLDEALEAVEPVLYLSLCPYGQPGDRLWVREAFRLTDTFDADSPNRVAERCLDAGYSKPWAPLQFEADGGQRSWMNVGTPTFPTTSPHAGKLRPGIHMPRWASRIDLEVTGVRVERLQDISEADADAEGCERLDSERDVHDWKLCPQCGGTGLYTSFGPNLGACPDTDCQKCDTYVKRYRHLWEAINGPESWKVNPWVWVMEFRRVQP